MKNYYQILNLPQNASRAEIKSAYRRLARKLHPDLNQSVKDTDQRFALIAEAYEVLNDPKQKMTFDREFAEFNAISGDISTVLYSDNSHARRLRKMALEVRYNKIVDRMIEAERDESLALQKVIFPIVALFVTTFVVAVIRPTFWEQSEIFGKIILLTLFFVGILHFYQRIRDGILRFTYREKELHDSFLIETEDEFKPYSRNKALFFLVMGFTICMLIGLIIGNYINVFDHPAFGDTFAVSPQPYLLIYPPIVVLLVDLVHLVISKFEV